MKKRLYRFLFASSICILVLAGALAKMVLIPTHASAPGLILQYMPEATSISTKTLEPAFLIKNTGSSDVALSDLTIRYWFGNGSSKPLQASCHAASIGCSTITQSIKDLNNAPTGANVYLEVGFSSGTLQAGSDTGRIEMRITRTDNDQFDQSDDYSFNASLTHFTDWQQAGLYQNGALAWGTDPAGNTAPPPVSGTDASPTDSPISTPLPDLLPTPSPDLMPTPNQFERVTNPTPQGAPTGDSVAIQLNPASVGTVKPGFVGLSYEKTSLGQNMFTTSNTGLANLFKLLGPGVLRIGGNQVDRTTWDHNGPGGQGGSKIVSASDVAQLAPFLKAVNWQVIYGINLKINNPKNAADEAEVAAQDLGSSLLAFEIGNEPDFYDSESAYESDFNSYANAILAAVPNAMFDGPGAASIHNPAWAATFAHNEQSNSQIFPHILMLSQHQYAGSSDGATIAQMLASNASGYLPDGASTMGKARTDNNIPQWRMTETNSFYNGGAAGVSDVEAASLWALDFMYGVASNNGDGVNFHNSIGSVYSPIIFSGATPTGVHPVYYSELLWGLAGAGPLYASNLAVGSTVTAWGIGNNVIVDNKGSSAIAATITLPTAPPPGTTPLVYILTGSSLSSQEVTINGSSINGDGTFTPSQVSANVSSNQVMMNVPANSAALLVIL
jgi:hypothetical protein